MQQKIALSVYFNISRQTMLYFNVSRQFTTKWRSFTCGASLSQNRKKLVEQEHHQCNSGQLTQGTNLSGSLSGFLWLSLAPIADGGMAQFLFDFVRPICPDCRMSPFLEWMSWGPIDQ